MNSTAAIPTEPGVYDKVDFETYQQIKAVNVSSLKPWLISPKYARWREIHPLNSDAARLGQAIHSYILDDDFHDRYATLDDQALIEDILADRPEIKNVRNTKDYKDAYARWEELNRHKTILKWNDMQTVLAAKHAFFSHPESEGVNIGREQSEVTIIWLDSELKCLCKMRADLFNPSSGRILDLKTIAKRPTVRVIERQVIDYAYHMQYAFYVRGILESDLHHAPTMRFCFLQTTDEMDVTWADPDESMLERGWRDVKRALACMIESNGRGVYRGVHPDAVLITMPSWVFDDEIIDDGTEVVDAE